MKKRLALFLTLLATLVSTFASPSPAYAIDNTPLPNMPTANGSVYAIVPDGAPAATYLETMKYNVGQIVEGLK